MSNVRECKWCGLQVRATAHACDRAYDAGRSSARQELALELDRLATYEGLLRELVDEKGPDVDDIVDRIEAELAKP